MGKTHNGPRHPHQNGEIPHVGEGSKCTIRSRKRRTPCRRINVQTEDDASETDVPTGQGFGYPPQIFTHPTHITMMPHMESKEEMQQRGKFLGEYCKFCDRCNETHCWCNSSNWEEELTNIDDPSGNPSIEKIPSPTVRKPPVGWSTFRHRVNREAEPARPPSPTEEADTDSGINMQ